MQGLIFLLVASAAAQPNCRCLPDHQCWPSQGEWQNLNASVNGQLEVPRKPPFKAACAGATEGGDASQCISELKGYMSNDFVPPTYSASTEATGMGLTLAGWQNLPSVYAVVAKSVEDISKAVTFAARHNLRLVIKGAGHDYFGRSTAPSSLLVWTHHMDQIQWAEDDLSVTIAAGVHWEDVYNQAQARGRYVLGGGCPTVGASGGFTLGAGFNEFFSRQHGTAAHNLLSATVVLADGSIVLANATQNVDLFWALRGGGGGTFGVVASVTFKTHDFPKQYGYVSGTVKCSGDAANKRAMLAEFLSFANTSLLNEHWGSAVTWNSDGDLGVQLGYNDISYVNAQLIWEPFSTAVSKLGCKWHWELSPLAYPAPFILPMKTITVKGGKKVAKIYPTPTGKLIPKDPKGRWVDSATINEMNAYWVGYASRYISMENFNQPTALAQKLDTLVNTAGGPKIFQIFFGKGLGGKVQFNTSEDISANPAVYEAGALLITAASVQNIIPDLPKSWEMMQVFEPAALSLFKEFGVPAACFTKESSTVPSLVASCWAEILSVVEGYVQNFNSAYTAKLRELFPGAGSYINEGDFWEPNWQESFWGKNYRRLKSIKDRLDPKGLFVCHHCVGSEEWSADGNCRVKSKDEIAIV